MSAKNFEATTSFSDSHNNSTVSNHEDSPESLDQRNNFRGTKIAKRARSFKEDFFEKISQMRTPTNTISRSHSPKTKNTQIRDDSSKSAYDINYHAKQVRHSLTHFKDVIAKNKLEMLSGNGTIVLETIANVHSALKAQKLNNTHNSAIISATQQVHHSLGNLIKLCDDALISENEEDFIALNKETVKEIVATLDTAVTNLVNLANEKADASANAKKNTESDNDQQQQINRSSLPDIPLSKKEKTELENSMLIQNCHSSESILHDLKPPPKPSKLKKEAPPLPPKRKTTSIDGFPDDLDCSAAPSNSDLSCARSIDFYNDFDNEAFSSPLYRSRTLNESSAKVLMSSFVQRKSNEMQFSSIQMKECQIKIDTDSDVQQIDNNFSSLSLTSQSSSKLKLMTEHNIFSNENLYLLDPSSEEKPPLPVKTRSLRLEHHKSMYDNVDDHMNRNSLDTKASTTSSTSSLTSTLSQTSARTTENIPDFHQFVVKNKYMSCIETGSNFGIDMGEHLQTITDGENPPPLPLKKKHIMAYMEIFGNASHHSSHHITNDDVTMMRHSVHSFSHSAKIQSQSLGFQSNLTPKKPALPPKQKQKINSSNASLNNSITPPVSPKISNDNVFSNVRNEVLEKENLNLNQENEEKKINNCDVKDLETVVLRRKPTEMLKPLMEELDLQDHLMFKKDSDDLSLIGGHIDALIIYATKNSAQKMSEELQILRGTQTIAFGEAFLLTFRTFIDPYDLVDKLIYRYNFFSRQNNDLKQKTAKESFSLLVRVVNDLTCPDLSTKLMEKLIQFVFDLVCAGELLMAKLLRVKVIEKAHALKMKNLIGPNLNLPCSRPIWSNPPNLLDLKSTEIAEQLTLLDSELFLKIEIPEILIWAEQQCEEKSPNLTQFTAHFNKLSYWARTQILKQQDAKDREKHVMKFIKIMKHLRKINNFNSYLALLSALDSAPIRRLEWQKNITEGLKEYCALIDSSSSFRAYRQALSETIAPCIPYIGLVLQDLTFVHIGNPDYLEDGSVNFSKRWQQSSLILNMKRFRNSSYTFKKNERITSALNFDEFFDEETMWQISEKIKPRGKKVLMN